MTVASGDILKATHQVLLADGSIAQNVYYLQALFASGQTDQTVMDAVEVWFEDMYDELAAELMATMLQDWCTLQEIQFNDITDQWEVYRLIGLFLPSDTFGNVSEALPNQTSAFASFNTARPKSRGRKFLYPFGEDRQAATILISAALTAMSNYAAIALNDVVIDVLNHLLPGIPRAAFDVFLPYTVAIVTDVMGTQRRRRPGVGA